MKSPSKYGNRKVVVDGVTFASAREARRYDQLKLLQRAGVIRDLELQKRFPLRVNGNLVCTYICDFAYHDNVRGLGIVEDAKGFRTREYINKAKLFEAIHGFKIVEV